MGGGGDLGVGVGGEFVGEDDVGGEDELDALGSRLLLELLGELDLVGLNQGAAARAVSLKRDGRYQPWLGGRGVVREKGGGEAVAGLPHLPTLRPRAARKVKTMPPPMTSLSHLPRRDSITPILEETCRARVERQAKGRRPCVRLGVTLCRKRFAELRKEWASGIAAEPFRRRANWHLGAADDGGEGALGVADGTIQVVQLLLEEEAGDRRLEELGDAGCGRVGAVGSAESVVDVPAP